MFAAVSMPFTVFLYTGLMRAIPRESSAKQAIVDGRGMAPTLLYICMPLMKS